MTRMTEQHIQLTPMTVLGAEVTGVDLGQPLELTVRDEIAKALSEYGGVLFFRNQAIGIEEHMRFALSFGEIYDYPIGLPNKDDEGESRSSLVSLRPHRFGRIPLPLSLDSERHRDVGQSSHATSRRQ